jgi:hypothetical protein
MRSGVNRVIASSTLVIVTTRSCYSSFVVIKSLPPLPNPTSLQLVCKKLLPLASNIPDQNVRGIIAKSPPLADKKLCFPTGILGAGGCGAGTVGSQSPTARRERSPRCELKIVTRL